MKIKANAVDPGHFEDLKDLVDFLKNFDLFFWKIQHFYDKFTHQKTLFYDLSKAIQSVCWQLLF